MVHIHISNLRFEYGAILNGSQTEKSIFSFPQVFEYGAILNGSQTIVICLKRSELFEYGAILNGSQTSSTWQALISKV